MNRESESFENQFSQKIVHMLEQTGPTEEQKKAIWKKATVPAPKRYPALRAALVASLALAVLMAGSIGVNAATDGVFFESVKKFCGLTETQQQVANETLTLPNEVYGPELIACSDKYVIFANERGLMIYDRALETLTAALDLQELDCNYFNAETITTHAYVEGDTLYLFNQAVADKNGTGQEADGVARAYLYDLTLAGQEEALCMTEDRARLAAVLDGWTSYSQNSLRSTFHEMQESSLVLDELEKYHAQTYYSKNCIRWTDAAGDRWLSFLVVSKEDGFTLYTRPEDGAEVAALALAIETEPADNGETRGLPEFRYTGDDAVLAAVLERTLTDKMSYLSMPGDVFIPASHIVKIIEDGDELIVFCNYVLYGYYRNGNTLNCESGGSGPARMRLTPAGDGTYTVTECLLSFVDEHVAFCEEYGVSPEIFRSEEYLAKRDEIRRSFIRMYVDENGLDDILYYKDFGWDPVSIR